LQRKNSHALTTKQEDVSTPIEANIEAVSGNEFDGMNRC